MSSKTISIITVCYNSVKYIEDCIVSVKNQTSRAYEHIIIDGGSTDGTIDVIKKYENTYPMKWVSEPDRGMYDAIVKGVAMSKGDILAWLNSDDMYQKDTVKIVTHIFEEKNIHWLTGFPIVYNEFGMLSASKQGFSIPINLFMKMGYPGKGGCGFQQESTFWTADLWKRASGEEIGKYKYAGDIILWRRFSHYEKIYVTDAVLSGFRKHSGQKSDNRKAYNEERWRWNPLTIMLKMLHVPEICSMLLYTMSASRVIHLSDLNF